MLMKNPNRLLIKIRRSVNRNLRDILNNQHDTIIPPIPKKYLLPKSPLRLLYNEAYYTHYAGLSYSALALCNVIIERITKILYRHFIPQGKSTRWGVIIPELKKFFQKSNLSDKKALINLMCIFDGYREDIRNLLLHGKIEEYLRSTRIEHTVVNCMTSKTEKIILNYNDEIHKNKSRILNDRMTSETQNLLTIISIVLRVHSAYIQDELL